MNLTQTAITIGLCILATQITRALPFFIFRGEKPLPSFVTYLGKALPGAVFGLLFVYCLKNVDFTTKPFALPEIAGVLITFLVHVWKKNFFLSISLGTFCYMMIVNFLV